MPLLRPLGNNIWTVPVENKLGGWLALNTRMTVVRLPGDRLVLHSPVPCRDDLRTELSELGSVFALLAPNKLHHLFLAEWKEHYPDALRIGAMGLEDKRPDLEWTHLLGDEVDAMLGEALQPLLIDGMPSVNESLFFHPESGTLIITDFLFHHPEAKGATRAYAWSMGFLSKVSCPPLFRLGIRDKRAFRASLARLHQLPVQQMSLCHHALVSSDAKSILESALRRLQIPPDFE